MGGRGAAYEGVGAVYEGVGGWAGWGGGGEEGDGEEIGDAGEGRALQTVGAFSRGHLQKK